MFLIDQHGESVHSLFFFHRPQDCGHSEVKFLFVLSVYDKKLNVFIIMARFLEPRKVDANTHTFVVLSYNRGHLYSLKQASEPYSLPLEL